MILQPRLSGGASPGMPLDDWLGSGFVLLGIGIDSATVSRITLGERWDALIARKIGLPLDCAPELADHDGQLLLLRPDRYVLARFTPAEAKDMTVALDDLLDETWRHADDPVARTQGYVIHNER